MVFSKGVWPLSPVFDFVETDNPNKAKRSSLYHESLGRAKPEQPVFTFGETVVFTFGETVVFTFVETVVFTFGETVELMKSTRFPAVRSVRLCLHPTKSL